MFTYFMCPCHYIFLSAEIEIAWWCILMFPVNCLSTSSLTSLTCARTCACACAQQLQHFQEAISFPLSCGVFGHFADEVIEVVQIADHERRMWDHRFIILKHILFGLSLSRVGETVQRILNDRPLNCLALKLVKVPIYIIYKLSGDVKSVYGDEMVRLEHLAFVIVSAKLENNCPNEVRGNDIWEDDSKLSYLLKQRKTKTEEEERKKEEEEKKKEEEKKAEGRRRRPGGGSQTSCDDPPGCDDPLSCDDPPGGDDPPSCDDRPIGRNARASLQVKLLEPNILRSSGQATSNAFCIFASGPLPLDPTRALLPRPLQADQATRSPTYPVEVAKHEKIIETGIATNSESTSTINNGCHITRGY
ncbi:hypothetical protein HYC85_024279 [Camellia sinensis]|uniref:Uncharacterized protein n=1 Tax=Camellia sinensis TaxID=4442 RepID=A0A7J7G7M9_CAMSI|nr:hypothetical protein HYC85_024279 [Camellia sinensis]